MRYFKDKMTPVKNKPNFGIKAALAALSLSLATVMASGSASLAQAAEGDVGTKAFTWSDYKALDSTTYPAGLGPTAFAGKVILLVVFQYNCGGCVANAPALGKLADSLGSGQAGVPFQAIGAEIDNGTFAQIQTSYNVKLKQNAANVKFPLVHVPFDTAIITDGTGTKWKRFNSYRDVYFVINPDGTIRARIQGNRNNAMGTVKYDSLRTQLVAALASATSIRPFEGVKTGMRVLQRGTSFVFDVSGMSAPVTVRIQDLQGRQVRAFTTSKATSFSWDGKDMGGKPVPYGTYFVRVSDGTSNIAQRITVLP